MCIYSPVHTCLHVTFPKQLRAIREERGFSLEEMAENVGRHVIELRHYETGYAHPTLKAVEEIAAALGIRVLTLLGYPPKTCERPARHHGASRI